jgi:hypothetical protein
MPHWRNTRCIAQSRGFSWIGPVAVLSLLEATIPALAGSVPNPTTTGPIPATAIPGQPSHDYPFFATNHDLATNGYIEEEFFIQGTANRYSTPPLTTATIVDSDHPYMTRVVVRRPANSRSFNGTVLVEWYNVTNGFDAENTWFFGWEHILRAGYVWVGVSAQRVGVDDLKTWNPTRYGDLDVTEGGTITDDALCYDIFSQAGQAIRQPVGVDLLGGLRPRVIIAIGESQSAFRLSTYVNSIHPLANLYQGFILLSSLGNPIRTDLISPVWKVLTEYDVGNSEASVRQPDNSLYRTWEVAGTSHVDQHLRASREPVELRDRATSTEAALAPTCEVPSIGTRVPTSNVLASAFDLLVRWIRRGTPPTSAPPIEIMQFGDPGMPSVIARDSFGLALGGIRLSQLAVPTDYNVGFNVGPGACVRWGYSIPFDVATLDQLYSSHERYLAQVTRVMGDRRFAKRLNPESAEGMGTRATMIHPTKLEIGLQVTWAS